MSKKIALLLLAFVLLSVVAQPLSATSRSEALAAARNASRDQARFKRIFSKLKSSDQLSVTNTLHARHYDDSDSDGVPDLVEHSQDSDSCDSDSNDDGISDGSERSAHGNITAVGTSSLSVAGLTFAITGSTSFIGLTQSDLAVGVCLEVEGSADSGGAISAVKVQADNNCSGAGGHHGGNDG